MRRQVKPFVTEYRGNGRRGKDPLSSSEFDELQTSRARSQPEAQRSFQSDPSEDSYEAALRAADALFAPVEADARETRQDEARASAPPPPAFRPPADQAPDDGLLPSAAAPVEPASVLPQGRILQAIEPPAEDRFALLEAERAPKRRGRKPGSKNKPKIVAPDDWSRPIAQPPVPAARVSPGTASPSRLKPLFEPAEAPVETRYELDAAVGPGVGELPAPHARARNDKFGRKRAVLRPGERWKRRLPKVAW